MPTSWGNDYAWTAIFSNNVIVASTVEDCIWAGSDVTCTDNLVADPDFVTWSDDGDWTNDDFHLLFGSAGIDHGVSGYAASTEDFEGERRSIDGDLDGTETPDAGPYEYAPDGDGDGHDERAAGGDDCDDEDDGVHPGAEERCEDGIDQDCDGADAVCESTADTADTADTASAGDSSGDTADSDGPPSPGDTRHAADTGAKGEGCAGCAAAPRGAGWSLWLVLLGLGRRRPGRSRAQG